MTDNIIFFPLVVLICLIFSINDGQMKLEESMDSNRKLDSHKCYLLDCGSELFLWVGKQLGPVNDRIAATRIVKVHARLINFFVHIDDIH